MVRRTLQDDLQEIMKVRQRMRTLLVSRDRRLFLLIGKRIGRELC